MSQQAVGSMKAIYDYFGKLPGQGMKDFSGEIKRLSPEDKHELAEGAARELGCILKEDAVA